MPSLCSFTMLICISSVSVYAQAEDSTAILEVLGRIQPDFFEIVNAADDLDDLIYYRAEIAARSGNQERLRNALSVIQQSADHDVNALISKRRFDIASRGNNLEERRSFIISVILPYLYPNLESIRFNCRNSPTFTQWISIGDVFSGSVQDAFVCSSATVNVATVRVVGLARDEAGSTSSIVTSLQLESEYNRLYYPDASSFTIEPIDNAAPTLLAAAGAAGQLASMQTLLDAGADLDLVSDSGYAAIHYAIESRQIESVEWLLSNGAQPDLATDDGDTPLHLAIAAGDQAMVTMLIDAGADVDVRRGDSSTPLLLSINGRNAEIARALLAAGADVEIASTTGETPLIVSTKSLDAALLGTLIDFGADVHRVDPDGKSALHHAASNRNAALTTKLLDSGADVNRASLSGTTALMIAAENGNSGVVDVLIARNANLEYQDKDGNTALLRSASSGQSLAFETLLREGARKSASNSNGDDAGSLAKKGGHSNVRRVLKHIKPLHIYYLKGGANLAKLTDDQHVSSVGGDLGMLASLKLQRRLRLQGELSFVIRVTDPDEDGPVTFPSDGDFYYWINSVDVRPSVRYAVTNPYQSHFYVLAGGGYSSIFAAELRDWANDVDGEDVTETTDTSMTYFSVGIGYEAVMGSKLLTTLELTYSSASSVTLDAFEGSLNTTTLSLAFGF